MLTTSMKHVVSQRTRVDLIVTPRTKVYLVVVWRISVFDFQIRILHIYLLEPGGYK